MIIEEYLFTHILQVFQYLFFRFFKKFYYAKNQTKPPQNQNQ